MAVEFPNPFRNKQAPSAPVSDSTSHRFLTRHILHLEADDLLGFEEESVQEERPTASLASPAILLASQEQTTLTEQELVGEILDREREKLSAFFGEDMFVSPLPREISADDVRRWRTEGFEWHYLPTIDILNPDGSLKSFPGWQVPPKDSLHSFIASDMMDASASTVKSGWFLTDVRPTPAIKTEGVRMIMNYPHDPLGPLIAALRQAGIFESRTAVSPESRFSVSAAELEKPVAQAVFIDHFHIKHLPHAHLRLPRFVEHCLLSNIHSEADELLRGRSEEWFADVGDNRPRERSGRLYGNIQPSWFTQPWVSDHVRGFRLLVHIPDA